MQTAQGSASSLLGDDQVGSFKAVAAMEEERGGLHDRFTGIVRFSCRRFATEQI